MFENYSYICIVINQITYCQHLKLIIMAKVNDLKKLIVINELYRITDVNGRRFFHASEIKSFSISFSEENKRTGLGRVKVISKLFVPMRNTLTYTFYGFYSHLTDTCDFRSVEISEEFKVNILLSINCSTLKIKDSWLLEEEGVDECVVGEYAGVCPEEVDDESTDIVPSFSQI